MLKRTVLVTLVLSIAWVAGSALFARSRAPREEAQSRAPRHEAAIGGYCPVAYVAMNTAMKGDPRYSSEYKGKTYLFSNADAKKTFDAAPQKYLVAYDGWSATAVAQGQKLKADPEQFTVYEGRTYLFSTADAKALFDRDKAGTVAKADATWPRIAKQTN